MFRLYSGHYAQLRQAYERMIRFMEERREQTLDEIAEVSRTMGGEAVDAIQDGLAELMQEGAYEEMLEQLRNMHRSMEDYQPLVNRIVNAGRNMEKQFESDEYIASSLWSIGENDYDLIELDDTYANSINIGCTEIIELGKKLKYTMDNIVELCSGIVDLREEQEKVNAAYVLSQRMGNFQTCFNRYVYDIRDLEYNLSRAFRGLTEEEPRIMGKAWETAQRQIITMQKALSNPEEADYGTLAEALTQAVAEEDIKAIEKILNGCVDEHNGTMDYLMLAELESRTEGPAKEILKELRMKELPNWNYADCMVEVKKEGGVLTILVLQDVLLEKDNTVKVTYDTTQENSVTGITNIACESLSYPEEYYKIAEEFMSQDQNGEYTFERVLRADIDYCGDTDRKVLALLMEDKYRVIETADSRADRTEYFDCVERAVENMFYANGDGGFGQINNYIDEEWLTALRSNMSDTSCGLTKLLDKMTVYQGLRREVEYGATEFEKIVDVKIVPHKVGLETQMVFRYGDIQEGSLYVPNKERTLAYLNTFDENTMKYLEELGYKEAEIINNYMASDSVADEGFVDDLIKGEYRELFRTNPDEIGEPIKILLPSHATKLFQLQDTNGRCLEMENFINEMFYQDKEYCTYGTDGYYVDDYVKLMTEQSILQQKFLYASVYNDEIGGKELYQSVSMTNFWEAIYMIYSDGGIYFSDNISLDRGYGDGEIRLQIKDLIMQPDMDISATIMTITPTPYDAGDRQGYKVENMTMFVTAPEREVWEADQAIVLHKIHGLEAEINKKWNELPTDVAVEVLGLGLPDAATDVLKGMVAFGNNDGYEMVSAVVEADSIEGFIPEKKAGETVTQVLGLVGTLMEHAAAIDELAKQKEEYADLGMTSWFYTVNQCTRDGEDVYLSSGITNYRVIRGISEWDANGFGWVLDEEKCDELNERIYDKISSVKMTEQEREAVLFMIFGGSVPEDCQTSYTSVLDIEPQLFYESVSKLDVLLEEALEDKTAARTYWHRKLNTGEWENEDK